MRYISAPQRSHSTLSDVGPSRLTSADRIGLTTTVAAFGGVESGMREHCDTSLATETTEATTRPPKAQNWDIPSVSPVISVVFSVPSVDRSVSRRKGRRRVTSTAHLAA
jgi:hypothetical protein